MISIEHIRAISPGAAARIAPHFDVLRKATSFALIGVINVAIDTAVFLLAYSYLNSGSIVLRLLNAFAAWCDCARPETLALISANITSWTVAVSCSYVMNSFITFAAESGRQLRWRDYITFVTSGILGAAVSTTVLVFAAQFMPVLAAKGCAILAAFGVNFSMSHFFVFRRRASPAELRPEREEFGSPLPRA
jgi:putative flippase GtrA